ncbi:polyphosphate kinase 2 [Pseudophaeobacter sp.]|uniref:polyphosphate kinase 2 n=1 Tax=Pseudophaeobacter sp. TaxID=1971739 RepID=UPI003A9821F2
MTLPYDGAISRYFETEAPEHVAERIKDSDEDAILNPDHPYKTRMSRKTYKREVEHLQIELVKMQSWVKQSGARIAILFEGRDAAGKGGTIKRFRENLNPRGARVVALDKPSKPEQSQWYFQRYINHLPSGGEITFFDRSWYNRGVVEDVFGFCTEEQRERFFHQVSPFEEALVDDGILLFKFWLDVSRAEQLRRFLSRENDPLKQWKLSPIDVQGLARWDDYSKAIAETLHKTHRPHAPWHVIHSDDKRRARLATIRTVLHAIDYTNKDKKSIGPVNSKICTAPDKRDV